MNNILQDFIVKKNIDYFKKYLDFIESAIKHDKEKIKQKEEEINKAVAENRGARNDADDYLDCLSEDHEQLEQIMYGAFIFSTVAFIEAQGIMKHKKSCNIFADEKLQDECNAVCELRNILIHEGRKISRKGRNEKDTAKKEKLKDFIKRHPEFLYINESEEIIIIKFEYAKSLIALYQNICDNLPRR